MKILLFITLLITPSLKIYAQETIVSYEARALNNINYNIGEGSQSSLNYERIFFVQTNIFLAGQIGFGFNEGNKDNTETNIKKYNVFPHHLTANFGKKRSFFEVGLTGLYIFGDVQKRYYTGPLLGYRLQPIKFKRVNFRAYINFPFAFFKGGPFLPGYDYKLEFPYLPFGVSVGFCI